VIALNKTIRLFLDSIGRRDEYEFYLDKFQSEHTACFALLCPDMGSIEAGSEVLAFDLHFLLRLELVPAILLCGGQVDAMRNALSAEPIFVFQALDDGAPAEFIQAARTAEKVPVLVGRHEATAEAVLLELIPSVAKRVHLIRAAGGLKSATGEPMPYVYTHKPDSQKLEPLEADYPGLAKTLLEQRPGVHVSITSPISLLEEIFTVKGAGTLFRKGIDVQHVTDMRQLDRRRLTHLLETSFGRALADETFLDRVCDAYLETDYRGAVLLEEHSDGLYLSKFAVGREARGEGVALELWREVCRNHRALFWRSNITNPFNSWYHKQADGHHRIGKWQIFWRGVSADAISRIVQTCCERPEDFVA
jgi:hypothetical protein